MRSPGKITDRVEHLINGLLLPGFQGIEPPGWLPEFPGLAGLVLFAHNTPDYSSTVALTTALRQIDPSLLIFSDEEGGDVTRVQAAIGGSLPGARAFGLAGNLELTEEAAKALGGLLRSLGVDAAFAPDLDVASEPENPVIGVRSYSSDAEIVAAQGAAFVRGFEASGVLSCGKHFPGHGDTHIDSHLSLPTLDVDDDALACRDLVPFQAAIDAGVPMIMTGHLRVPQWGDLPASLNPVATRWLREHGFTGAIVTDALDMRGISEGIGMGEAAVRAVEAGADLLCLGNTTHATYSTSAGGTRTEERLDYATTKDVQQALARALSEGRICEESLIASAARVGELRAFVSRARTHAAEIGLLPGSMHDALDLVGRRVATRAVTARGDVTLRPGDLLVDMRRLGEHAAGAVSPALVRALVEELGLQTVDVEDFSVEDHRWQGKRIAILTRGPSSDAAELVKCRPDAVVLHAGEPAVAVASTNLVLALGVARANAAAVIELCRPA